MLQGPAASRACEKPPSCQPRYYKVLYLKQDSFFKKVAKKAVSDGTIEVAEDGMATLYNEGGKSIWCGKARQVTGPGAPPAAKAAFKKRQLQMNAKKGKAKQDDPLDGEEDEDETIRFELNSLLAEVEQPISPEDFGSGACFKAASRSLPLPASSQRQFVMPKATGDSAASLSAPPRPRVEPYLHHPEAPGALVLNMARWKAGSRAVVVDPYLAKSLRPHQKVGVEFLYRCTMEQVEGMEGCILADEMGLGKTLQVIALVWTLLRQSPEEGRASVKKAIVVAPASLVQQWAKEVTKWLGSERLKAMVVMAGPQASDVIDDFKAVRSNYRSAGLLVTSYETIRKYGARLKGSCDLLICDEAHRLKSQGGNQTTKVLLDLGCRRRVLLTGTPVQNNLDEYYALLCFVAPDLLGDPGQFKRVYGDPISLGRDRDCTHAQRELGEARARKMAEEISPFVLRRTQDILTKHLPPLSQLVVFCRPSTVQVTIYRHILQLGLRVALEDKQDTCHLALISALRKLCNSPALLRRADELVSSGAGGSSVLPVGNGQVAWLDGLQVPGPAEAAAVEASGKLDCLSRLLSSIVAAGQRCVVVSTSTAARDLIDNVICQPQGYSSVRIDGSISVHDRQGIVDGFNLQGRGQVFMLSTRAGGAGLNLIGASNLVLFDSDWNPAADQQAMARIWRDGQKRPCTVFRFLTTGTLEEKVYQRQIMKGDLAVAVSDLAAPGAGSKAQDLAGASCWSSAAGRQFSRDDLKHLFAFVADCEDCETRQLLTSSMGPEQQPLKWLNLGADGPQADQQCAAHLLSCFTSGLVTAAGMVLKNEVALLAEAVEVPAEGTAGEAGAE